MTELRAPENFHHFDAQVSDRLHRLGILNPLVPGFDERYLTWPHVKESWYMFFQALDMSVELVSSNRDTCRIYFGHFYRHWCHDKNLIASDRSVDMEVRCQRDRGDPAVRDDAAAIGCRHSGDAHDAGKAPRPADVGLHDIDSRSLTDEIVLTPGNGELRIDLKSDLAGILALSSGNKRGAPEIQDASQQIRW